MHRISAGAIHCHIPNDWLAGPPAPCDVSHAVLLLLYGGHSIALSRFDDVSYFPTCTRVKMTSAIGCECSGEDKLDEDGAEIF